MLDIEKLKTWSWENLQFNNNPENIEDTYIIDIVNGYSGTCYTVYGKAITYQHIRNMFTI